jgi:hypothetical protein
MNVGVSYRDFFYCCVGNHAVPKLEIAFDRGGFLMCPVHHFRLRTHGRNSCRRKAT